MAQKSFVLHGFFQIMRSEKYDAIQVISREERADAEKSAWIPPNGLRHYSGYRKWCSSGPGGHLCRARLFPAAGRGRALVRLPAVRGAVFSSAGASKVKVRKLGSFPLFITVIMPHAWGLIHSKFV